MANKSKNWASWILKSATTNIRFENVTRQDYEREHKTCIEYWDKESGEFVIEKHLTADIFSIVHPHAPHPGTKAREKPRGA